MALAALAERDDVPEEWVTWAPETSGPPVPLRGRVPPARAREARDGACDRPVLAAHESIRHELIAEFVRARQEAGEEVDSAHVRRGVDRGRRRDRGVRRRLGGGARPRFPVGVRGVAGGTEPRERRADLGPAVRPALDPARRPQARARRARRLGARADAAALRPARRRARRREDRARARCARPAARRSRPSSRRQRRSSTPERSTSASWRAA